MNEKNDKIAARLVPCPRCRKSVRYDTTNPNRPFCSALCKNEDIISWAEQGYRIAGEPVDPEAVMPEPRPRDGDDEG